ncbi:monovalent cation/H+ antiporter complex subunit F [Clavibacter michiganensis subsp. phaseoli]|jgi:multicomponent Na+:H+ antiporter subunit F|uniref:Sodium:proton antiporter n=1 Tax=Clavibacter phaseoli TaxID=1734031 RepID=A0A8I0VG86_9MICO|nr:monovalent cation/H+ antiporter complex subunit F [Clavibacter phaseoli]MBF4630244.1 sodium:proton antiporter [Clavibacter phaseoli]MCJ1710534.1 monovalent cation/H+ antiporter complex subunit F [Clavibacter phaseoli]
MSIVMQVGWVVVGALFFSTAAMALVRIVRGPSILDRIIASDVLLTTLICVLGAEMIHNGHTRTVPVMLVLAMTAFLATVAVARYVSKQDPS